MSSDLGSKDFLTAVSHPQVLTTFCSASVFLPNGRIAFQLLIHSLSGSRNALQMYLNRMMVQHNHFPYHIMVDAVLQALDVSVPQTVVNGPWSHTALLLSCDALEVT